MARRTHHLAGANPHTVIAVCFLRQIPHHTHSQHVHKLCYRVALFNDDLLGPMYECGIGILHAHRDHRSQNIEGLTYYAPGVNCMGLQQAVEGGRVTHVSHMIAQYIRDINKHPLSHQVDITSILSKYAPLRGEAHIC